MLRLWLTERWVGWWCPLHGLAGVAGCSSVGEFVVDVVEVAGAGACVVAVECRLVVACVRSVVRWLVVRGRFKGSSGGQVGCGPCESCG